MSSTKRTNHLLVIGIDRYRGEIDELFNAVSDAEAFVDVLQEKYQFSPEHTYTLYNREATKDNIYQKFDFLIDKLTENDTLILYFSGHGEFIRRTNRGYWLPVDAVHKRRGTYISNNEIIDFFNSLKAFHIFAVIDSCFSGALFRSVSSEQTRYDNFESRWLLTAGRTELVSDGLSGSPFSKSLLSYLKNTTEEYIPVAKLCHDVLEGVLFNAKQTPRGEPLQNVGHQGGQFIFYKKGVEVTVEEVEEAGGKKRGLDSSSTTNPTVVMPVEEPVVSNRTYASLKELRKTFKNKARKDLKRLFRELEQVLGDDSRRRDDLIILESRYHNIEQQQMLGTVSFDQISLVTNQIRQGILNMIDNIEQEDLKSGIVTVASEIEALEREGMSNMEKLIVRKINFIQEKLLIETDASVQFKYQIEIDQLKEQLQKLR